MPDIFEIWRSINQKQCKHCKKSVKLSIFKNTLELKEYVQNGICPECVNKRGGIINEGKQIQIYSY